MSAGPGSTWGKKGRSLLSLEEAWDAIASQVTPLGVTSVPLDDAAGRVLARPIVASADYPPFDKAMMDGFAVRSADCPAAGAELNIVGLAPAGDLPSGEVGPGQTMQINTGAPLPPGADAVVKVESTTSAADGTTVRINAPARPEENITRRGSTRQQGDIVLSPPTRMEAAQLAAAASAGVPSVEVHDQVDAAIVVTGDELVPFGGNRGPGQIFESNGIMLASLMRQFGARSAPAGIARDRPAELKQRLAQALKQPLVIAVGGMSMGTRDLVPQAVDELGVHLAFHGVAVRPGKPIAYGRGPAGQHVFGLPGNPVSVFVCAWLFVRMVIRGLQGFPPRPPQRWPATLAGPLKAGRDQRPAFLPGRVWNDPHKGLTAQPCEWTGSADPFGLALANALLVRTRPTEAAEPGDVVEVILISSEA